MSTGISQREATFMLQCGVGLTERLARRVLAAGLVGRPHRLPGTLVYDRDRVAELIARSPVSEAELDECCPHGLFVARRARGLDAGGLDVGWKFSPWTCVWMRVRIERHGSFPLVATVGGYVVRGADILDASTAGTLRLAEPGPWLAPLLGRRLPTGPGRPWWIRGWDRPHGRLTP